MPLLEQLVLVTTAVLVLTGLSMIAFSLRAYARTSQHSLIHLAVGFTLIVAAASQSAISAFLLDFGSIRTILMVHSGLNVFGYLFVIYSLAGRRGGGTQAPAERSVANEPTNTQ